MSRQTPDQAAEHASAPQPRAERHWINAGTVRKGSTVMLCISILIFALGAWVTDGFTDTRITGPASDFSVFWGHRTSPCTATRCMPTTLTGSWS